MSDDRTPLKWFRVRDDDALRSIPGFIKSLGKYSVNTYGGPRLDRKGNCIITLGWDTKPDSDWGRYSGHKAAIWFANETLADKAEQYVRKGLGWPEIEAETGNVA